MASFKRSRLKAIGLNDDQIEAVIEAHNDVVAEITADRDRYKTEAEKLPDVQKQLHDAQEAAKGDGKDYKTLYTELVQANEAKAARSGKEKGYKSLLKSINVPEKFWPMIIKANTADIDKIELDGETVKDADKLAEGMKQSLADYVSTITTEDGNKPGNPPQSNHTTVTQEEFGKMSYRQRKELYEKDPDTYKNLTK